MDGAASLELAGPFFVVGVGGVRRAARGTTAPARLRPGQVELSADGAALRVVPVHEDTLDEADGRLVIQASGVAIRDELVQALRYADRR